MSKQQLLELSDVMKAGLASLTLGANDAPALTLVEKVSGPVVLPVPAPK